MILVLDILLLVITGIFGSYLAMLSLLALLAEKKTEFPATLYRRFAVVIPAHNEELALERTIRSLQALAYPADRFEIVVVADTCTDASAGVARGLGVKVAERTDSDLRGKGYALRWIFDKLTPPQAGFDAIVVIDADSVASRNFLTVMNHYLESGSEAIQCNDMVEPRAGVWVSEVIRFGFTLYNYVRPMGRRVLGFSAGIRGNGMCYSTRLLREIPWDAYSLNEDLEYGLRLLLGGTTVAFAAEALVHATMPQTSKHAESQRRRWERGRYPVIRRYTLPLLGAALRRRSFEPLDAVVDLLTPPFVNLYGAILIAAILHAVLLIAGNPVQPLLAGWAVVLALATAHVVIGLPAAGADAALYRAFLYIPRYALWKVSLYLRTFGRRSGGEWIRTTRERGGRVAAHDVTAHSK